MAFRYSFFKKISIYKSIGFYKFKNFEYQSDYNNKSNDNIDKIDNSEGKNIKKTLLIAFGILIILILIIISFFLGKFFNKQRKKRANELKDEDFEYIEENFKEDGNKLIN